MGKLILILFVSSLSPMLSAGDTYKAIYKTYRQPGCACTKKAPQGQYVGMTCPNDGVTFVAESDAAAKDKYLRDICPTIQMQQVVCKCEYQTVNSGLKVKVLLEQLYCEPLEAVMFKGSKGLFNEDGSEIICPLV
jgi:hypothetical protein